MSYPFHSQRLVDFWLHYSEQIQTGKVKGMDYCEIKLGYMKLKSLNFKLLLTIGQKLDPL
jgi:hypothetical protein